MYGKTAESVATITDPDAWIASLDEAKRADIEALDRRIQAKAPGLDRHMDHGMLAFGHFTYRYPSGREGEWFPLGLAATKAGISIYVSPIGVETYRDRFPKASLGKGCIRAKRVADLDEAALDDLIADAAAHDGTHFTGG